MMKHRILILTNRVPYPLNDGGALATHFMIEGYYKAGWEVFLFSMNTSRHYVSIESLPELYREIRFEDFDINTDIKFVPVLMNFLLSRKPNHAGRFYDKDFEKKLKKIIEDFDPEVIQIESIYLAIYISSIREISHAKIVIRLHNIEHQIWEKLSNESSSFRKYYLKDLASRIKRFEINAWSQADVLIPITATDAAFVKELSVEKKIITAPFGIETKKRTENIEKEKWIGYHIGAMDWMPNAEGITWFLEEVWPSLRKELPDFEFHFAGRNMPGSFEKFEHDGVVCSGEVADADEFIADKKILIVPLRSGGGIRVKVLEAMAAGKIVISTMVGMQGISATPGIHFLLAEYKDDFIRQIKWVMENKERGDDISKAGAAMVLKEYDQDKIMADLISELNAVLS